MSKLLSSLMLVTLACLWGVLHGQEVWRNYAKNDTKDDQL